MNFKAISTEAFENVEPQLQALSKWLYENPELRFEEFESSRRLANFLDEQGFDVEYPAHGLETAFEANFGSSGPRVVICAEYDALPDVGHACGHNIIATAGLGAGVAAQAVADELGIRITVLGTPGEEGSGGKIDLIEAGAFEDATAAMMIHPSIRDTADPLTLASQGVTVTYRGKEAHAAATPHIGVNALDAFVHAYTSISTLRQHFLASDRVHGVIDEGGVAPNVVPAMTKSTWIVRAETFARLEVLSEKVMNCFEAAATSTGCTVEFEYESKPYADLISDQLMARLFQENSMALGRQMPTTAETGQPAMASTDMGNVSYVVPTIHPSLAIDTSAVNHQPEFAAATVTPSGNDAIRDGALGMAHTIVDLAVGGLWDQLTKPEKG